MNNFKPKTNKYYLATIDFGWVRVKGRKINIQNFKDLDLFIHRPILNESKDIPEFSDELWAISEGKTGCLLTTGFDKQTDIKMHVERILIVQTKEKFVATVDRTLNSKDYIGLSPRYKG